MTKRNGLFSSVHLLKYKLTNFVGKKSKPKSHSMFKEEFLFFLFCFSHFSIYFAYALRFNKSQKCSPVQVQRLSCQQHLAEQKLNHCDHCFSTVISGSRPHFFLDIVSF